MKGALLETERGIDGFAFMARWRSCIMARWYLLDIQYQVSSANVPYRASPLPSSRARTPWEPRGVHGPRPTVHGAAILVSAHGSEYTVSQATACARIDLTPILTLTLTLTWDRHGDLVSMPVFMFVFMFPHVKIRPGALGAFLFKFKVSHTAQSTRHTARGVIVADPGTSSLAL